MQLILERTFAAPRPLVFQAWTDPVHLAKWWGPHRFTNPRCEIDPRAGGAIHIDMQGPDGTIHPMIGRIVEINPPALLVFTSAALDAAGQPMFEILNRVQFDVVDDGTKITMEARVTSTTAVAPPYLAGMRQGWIETLERLQSHAERNDPELMLSRIYDAPREMVFAAFTDPEQVPHWWGPRGFTITTQEIEVRPGGRWRFMMHGPNGVDYPSRISYSEIVVPQRIVYDHGTDEDNDPNRFHVTITFDALERGTRVIMHTVFPTAAARNFTIGFGSIELGYQTLAKLGEHLEGR